MGYEPTTLYTQDTELTTKPPRSTVLEVITECYWFHIIECEVIVICSNRVAVVIRDVVCVFR